RFALAGQHELSTGFTSGLEDGIEEGDGPLSHEARQGRVIAAPALAQDERLPQGWREAAAADGYRALLAVPVETPRDEAGGLVVVFFDKERVFTEDDLELARHLANATQGALERSELFE